MADISTGADAIVDEVLSYQKVNKLKNHYYGATAPADAVAGMIWIDSDDDVPYRYDGAAWVALVPADGSAVLTGTMQWKKGADIASANTLVPGADGNYFDVTGTTAILAINAAQSQPGTINCYHFDGILTLTHHATDLILPSGANITTAAGDEAIFVEYAADDWRCICYTKASGEAVVVGAVNLKTGTYTGDGTEGQGITGVGFQPKFVIIFQDPASGAGGRVMAKMDQSWGTDAIGVHSGTIYANHLLSLDADGFTVDDAAADEFPNQNGINYDYIAWA